MTRHASRRPQSISNQLALAISVSATLTAFVQPVSSQTPEDTLRAYAVNIHQTPMQSWGPGYGIYVGKGNFLTAAHVAGRPWLTHPKVIISGKEFPTRVVKQGQIETTDLTMLAVDEALLPMRLRLRRMNLCRNWPWPDQKVVTVIPEVVVRTRIIAPERIPAKVRKFSTAVVDVAQTGNSGSGVFDEQKRCLLGIMSRKISQKWTNLATHRTETRDIAKYFVPAPEIGAFVPLGTFDQP